MKLIASACNCMLRTLVLLCLPALAHTQIVWDNASAGSDWYTATNWTPNMAQAAWAANSEATFISAGTRTIGIDMSVGPLSIGKINATIGSLLTNAVTIGNSSSSAGTLTLNGDGTGNIISATFNSLDIGNGVLGGSGSMDIALTNSNSNVMVSFSTIKIGAAITGPGKSLSFNAGSGGGGTVELTGANLYTGLTNTAGGGGSSSITLSLSHAGGGTLPAGNSVFVGGKSTLRIKTDQTLNTLTLAAGGFNGFLVVEDGATLTITNKLKTGPGQISVVGSGKIAYAPGATLEYYGTPSSTVYTSAAEFPAVNGPANLVNNFSPFLYLHDSRVISGDLNGGLLYLNDNNLTTGSVTLPAAVVTNGLGGLFATVSTNPVTFPVCVAPGVTNYVTISNGQNIVYGVRVAEDITPALATSNNAVNRTWYIKPGATPASAPDVQFNYANTDGNPGFNYSTPVELLQYTSAWNVVQTNIPQLQPVNTTIGSLVGGTESIFAIQNATGALATAGVDIAASMQNGSGFVSWKFNQNTADIKLVTLEKSADGRNFTTLTTTDLRQVFYVDNNLQAGKNYYRIKATDVYGKITYSAIVALLNSDGGFDIVSLQPNIVTTTTKLSIAAAKKTQLNITVTDAAGRAVQHYQYNVQSGSSQLDITVQKLPAGLYYLTAATASGEVRTIRFVKQ